MHTVHIGYSSELTGKEMRQLFDIDPDHPELLSKFSQLFGGGYIDPGSHETYDKTEQNTGHFTAEYLDKLFPFELDKITLLQLEEASAQSVFYVETGSVHTLKSNSPNIHIIKNFEFEKYDFE